jgi:hypothetical protein
MINIPGFLCYGVCDITTQCCDYAGKTESAVPKQMGGPCFSKTLFTKLGQIWSKGGSLLTIADQLI